jgi:hypothetical protein
MGTVYSQSFIWEFLLVTIMIVGFVLNGIYWGRAINYLKTNAPTVTIPAYFNALMIVSYTLVGILGIWWIYLISGYGYQNSKIIRSGVSGIRNRVVRYINTPTIRQPVTRWVQVRNPDGSYSSVQQTFMVDRPVTAAEAPLMNQEGASGALPLPAGTTPVPISGVPNMPPPGSSGTYAQPMPPMPPQGYYGQQMPQVQPGYFAQQPGPYQVQPMYYGQGQQPYIPGPQSSATTTVSYAYPPNCGRPPFYPCAQPQYGAPLPPQQPQIQYVTQLPSPPQEQPQKFQFVNFQQPQNQPTQPVVLLGNPSVAASPGIEGRPLPQQYQQYQQSQPTLVLQGQQPSPSQGINTVYTVGVGANGSVVFAPVASNTSA